MNERVHIDIPQSSLLGVLALLALLALLTGAVLFGAASPSLARTNGDALEAVKLIVCGVLVVWIILAGIFWVLTGVLLWIEFNDCVVYRCFLGLRSIPWRD